MLGGIGITAIGPGGVLVTIGLFALTDLPADAVAGTAIVTHVGTGLLGSAAYVRSGQLRQAATARLALVLGAAAVVGAPAGVLVNAHVSTRAFGVVLGACLIAIGALVALREQRRTGSRADDRGGGAALSLGRAAAIGLAVALVSGLLGLGGPLLAVPLLVTAGLPMLPALGAAQAQSIVIAAAGTIGYAIQGAISWSLALLVGVPELAGVVLGWRLAHALPVHRLRLALAAVLVALGPYLIAHNA